MTSDLVKLPFTLHSCSMSAAFAACKIHLRICSLVEKQSVYFLPLVAPVLRAPASCLNKRHKANETKKGKLVANSSLTSQQGSTVH